MWIEVYARGGPVAGDVFVIPPGLPEPPTAGELEALRAYARAGGKVLALGDGVAWPCAAGLLPGDVTAARPDAPATHVRVEGRATAFTWAIPAGRIVALARPAPAHRYAAPDTELAALEASGRIVLRYCDGAGGLDEPRPSARAATVAALCDDSGRVVGVVAPTAADLACALGRQLLACLRPR
jgi:phosphoribosylformylglycinamidine (FGAM) synthase-like amidotransferase family enzyme